MSIFTSILWAGNHFWMLSLYGIYGRLSLSIYSNFLSGYLPVLPSFWKLKICVSKSSCSLSSPRLHQIRALMWDLAAVKEVVVVQLSLLLPPPNPAVKNEGISEAAFSGLYASAPWFSWVSVGPARRVVLGAIHGDPVLSPLLHRFHLSCKDPILCVLLLSG